MLLTQYWCWRPIWGAAFGQVICSVWCLLSLQQQPHFLNGIIMLIAASWTISAKTSSMCIWAEPRAQTFAINQSRSSKARNTRALCINDAGTRRRGTFLEACCMRKTQVSMYYKILQLIWRIGVLNWGSLGLLGHAKKGIRLVFITTSCSPGHDFQFQPSSFFSSSNWMSRQF